MTEPAKRTAAAIAAVQRASVDKRRRAWAAFDEMAAEGHAGINFTTVAERAKVSTDLLYKIEELADRIKEVRDRGGRRRTARAIKFVDHSSLANERARAAHLTRELQDTRKQLALAERAIARAGGVGLDVDSSERDAEVERLTAEVARLDGDLILVRDEVERLKGQLRDREEAEQAARENARDFFKELQKVRAQLDQAQSRLRTTTTGNT